MKTNLTKLSLFAALGLIGFTGAHAESYIKWPLVQEIQATQGPLTLEQQAPYGHASSRTASRVINLDGNSKYLNVTRFETVQINVGGKNITWTFDTLNTRPFSLAKIVPGAENITVYVSDDPSSRG